MGNSKMLTPWCRRTKAIMAYNGITVAHLAKKIGRSRPWTSLALNGASVSADMMDRIDQALSGVDCPDTGQLSQKEGHI